MSGRAEPAEKVVESVKLWSGHDVNLTLPVGSDGHSPYPHTKTYPTLAQVAAFVTAARDAGYLDADEVTVSPWGLKVRRGDKR